MGNRTALVTGGTGGLGAGVTEALLAAGWEVVATGVSADEVAQVPETARLSTALLDVTDPESIEETVGRLEALHGLVNCAGILMRGREYEIENFQRVLDVNLVGTMRMCTACKSLLSISHGSIVNVASMLTFFGGPLVPAYAASKGGVGQLTRSLAGAWAEDGVRVNAVAPGWIETPMTQGLREDAGRTNAIMARTPMNRWGRPREVGEVVAHLLSDAASFVTGAIVPVDGGYSAT